MSDFSCALNSSQQNDRQKRVNNSQKREWSTLRSVKIHNVYRWGACAVGSVWGYIYSFVECRDVHRVEWGYIYSLCIGQTRTDGRHTAYRHAQCEACDTHSMWHTRHVTHGTRHARHVTHRACDTHGMSQLIKMFTEYSLFTNRWTLAGLPQRSVGADSVATTKAATKHMIWRTFIVYHYCLYQLLHRASTCITVSL